MLPSPDMVLKAAGCGLLVPAAVTAGGLALARCGGLRQGAVRIGEVLAVAAGLAAGFIALAASGELTWEFLALEDAWHWLPLLSVAAAVVGVADRALARCRLLRWGVRLVVAGVAAWLLVRGESAYQEVSPGWYAGLTAAVLALWGVLDPAVGRWPGAWPALLLAVVGLSSGAVLALAGIMKFALVAAVPAAVLGGCAGAAWGDPGESAVRPALPAFAVALPGLLFSGWFNTFSDVPAASFLLVWAAPLALGVTAFLLAPSTKRWPAAVQAAAVLAPVGAALALAALA